VITATRFEIGDATPVRLQRSPLVHRIEPPVDVRRMIGIAEGQSAIAKEIELTGGQALSTAYCVSARPGMVREDRAGSLGPRRRLEDEPWMSSRDVMHERMMGTEPIPLMKAGNRWQHQRVIVAECVGKGISPPLRPARHVGDASRCPATGRRGPKPHLAAVHRQQPRDHVCGSHTGLVRASTAGWRRSLT
jgi:hypothetical protein